MKLPIIISALVLSVTAVAAQPPSPPPTVAAPKTPVELEIAELKARITQYQHNIDSFTPALTANQRLMAADQATLNSLEHSSLPVHH